MALKNRLSKKIWGTRRKYFMSMIALLFIFASSVVYIISPFRFDFNDNAHKIIPVGIDTDVWGNYRVYFKTNPFDNSKGDDFYYIDKSQNELAQQAAKAIVDDKEIVVYCDKYVGLKGFTAPLTSPIVKIETIRPDIGPIPITIKSLNINPTSLRQLDKI